MRNCALKLLIGAFLLSIATIGCSKFEDGPGISIRKISNRIAGDYRIVYISKNGTDITPFWNQNYDLEFSIYRLMEGATDFMYSIVSGKILCDSIEKTYSNREYLEVFIQKEVTLKMKNYFTDSLQYPGRLLYPVFILYGQEPPLFLVTRLTNDEMWLRHTNGIDEYEIHFKE